MSRTEISESESEYFFNPRAKIVSVTISPWGLKIYTDSEIDSDSEI